MHDDSGSCRSSRGLGACHWCCPAASQSLRQPGRACRQQILEQYAQHLPAQELQGLAALTSGCSGRDLRDLCEQAERHWAAKVGLRLPLMICGPVELFLPCTAFSL